MKKPGKLFPQERRQAIINLIDQFGRVDVNDLSERFSATQATIRADLEWLASEGLITRTHGGAITAARSEREFPFEARSMLRVAEKDRIGAAAAALVEDGDAIILDASTTALAVARHLHAKRELTVLTNGLRIVMELVDAPGVRMMMTGGFVRRETVSVVGADFAEFLSGYNFRYAMFGAKGVSISAGLTDVHRGEVDFKRSMLSRARQLISIVDSTKWGQTSFASYAPVDAIHTMISDEAAPQEMVEAMRARGIQVILT